MSRPFINAPGAITIRLPPQEKAALSLQAKEQRITEHKLATKIVIAFLQASTKVYAFHHPSTDQDTTVNYLPKDQE
jgi:hypothetical protein